jgi:hypothetical protein
LSREKRGFSSPLFFAPIVKKITERETLVRIENESFVRLSDSMPTPLKGDRPKVSPTHPSVLAPTWGIPWRGGIGPTV